MAKTIKVKDPYAYMANKVTSTQGIAGNASANYSQTQSNGAEDYFRIINSPLNTKDYGEYNPRKINDYFAHSPQNREDHGVYDPKIIPKTDTDKGDESNVGGGGIGGGVSVTGIGGGNSLTDRMNSQFQVSQSYLDAMNYTQSLLDKISSGRTSYTDQLNDIMNQISNREKFSYDMSKDTMFQEYLSEMMGSGQTAMRDTIGQASALTGGYGSSYATVAGNQAYNSMIQDAYSNLPDYYNMALSAYNAEGEQLMNQYGMLSQADATEYGRLMDAYNANYNQAQNLYGQEYQRWMDDVNNAFNLAKFAEEQRQFNAEMGYKNASLAQSQKQWEAEMAYKQKQDGVKATADAKASILKHNQDVADAKKAEAEAIDKKYNNDTYISKMISEGREIYQRYGDGEDFKTWADTFIDPDVPDSVYKKIMDGARVSYGKPMEERTFTKISDTEFQDEYGNKFVLGQLPESKRKNAQRATKGSIVK